MVTRPVYGGSNPVACAGGGVVASVEAGSPAERAGVVAGDVIATADSEPLRDVIDWRWNSDGPRVTLGVLEAPGDPGGEPGKPRSVVLERAPGEQWGIEFAETLFDGVRTCRNTCAFCFMSQLPRGLRPALYVRDDDFRLSFLQGNFVTLTNIDDADVDRILTQHLSPLYVSLHAVNPAIRERLLCVRGEDRALEAFDVLAAAGIETHVQIVAVPGVNDADELDATLNWLATREGVLSVGVVPLGYTAHQDTFARSYEDPASASALLERIQPWREAFFARDGVRWVHAADELHLVAAGFSARDVPPAEDYDGFPQYENGIGLVRAFLDEWEDAAVDLDGGRTAVVVTGELFAPVLESVLEPVDAGGGARVLPVENRFFGGNVSVTGLLTASDIIAAIAADGARGPYLVPDVILNADGLTLDGTPGDLLGQTAGADVRLVSSTAAGLAAALAEA